MGRVRADMLLVARGLAESRAKAQAAIEAGGVVANGQAVRRASQMLDETCALTLEPAHPYVSRGGVKLAHALDAFGVDPAGRVCLDVGASTGGFTEVLLLRGAARVVAVDVGRAQLHPRLAGDPRVVSLEGRDARSLTREDLPEGPSLVTADVSFIGLAKALPAALALAAERADLVALVKPQFEAGPGAIGKNGLVPDDEATRACAAVAASLDGAAGFRVRGLIDSPIRGGDGQRERLLHAARP